MKEEVDVLLEMLQKVRKRITLQVLSVGSSNSRMPAKQEAKSLRLCAHVFEKRGQPPFKYKKCVIILTYATKAQDGLN